LQPTVDINEYSSNDVQVEFGLQGWCVCACVGHNGVVRCIAHSPVGPAFVSCSDDYRARFWHRKNDIEWTDILFAAFAKTFATADKNVKRRRFCL